MRLKDKIAVVTGSGTGIGKAIAVRFAKEGAHVVGAEINEAAGQQTAAEVSAQDRRGLFVKTDMGKVEEINAMVSKAIETFGKIDILVNNAGVTRSRGFFDVTEKVWDWIHSINAKGYFFCMQAVARESLGDHVRGCAAQYHTSAGRRRHLCPGSDSPSGRRVRPPLAAPPQSTGVDGAFVRAWGLS